MLSSAFVSFDFLGYEFWLNQDSNKIHIQYGITQEKRDKYSARLEKIISLYTNPNSFDSGNEELLRHRIAAFTSRAVYLGSRYSSNIWKVKGFISNYGELRYMLGTGLVHPDTEEYLKTMVENNFSLAGFTPYFILGAPKSVPGYNLYQNMRVNKTILLVEGIGFDYESLANLCKKIGINNFDANGNKRTYSSLVRDYLIKVNIGY